MDPTEDRYEILALRWNMSQHRVTIQATSKEDARQQFEQQYPDERVVIVAPFWHDAGGCEYCDKGLN